MAWCLMSHLIATTVNEAAVAAEIIQENVAGNLRRHPRSTRTWGEIGEKEGRRVEAERDARVEKGDSSLRLFVYICDAVRVSAESCAKLFHKTDYFVPVKI